MAESLTTDKTALLSKVAKSAAVLKKADTKLLANKAFMMDAVAANPCAIKYAAKNLLDDKKFIIKILSDNGLIYRYLPTEWKCDGEIIVAAIKNTLEVVPFVSEKALKFLCDYDYLTSDLKNRNIAIFLAQRKDPSLRDAIKYFRDDKEIALLAVRISAFLLLLFSQEIRTDRDVLVCAYAYSTLSFLAPELKKEYKQIYSDREIIKQVTIETPQPFIDPHWNNDKEIVMLALARSIGLLKQVSEELRDDKDVIMFSVSKFSLALQYASERLKDDKEIVAMAVKDNGYSLRFASERLRDDKEIVTMAVLDCGSALEYASERMRDDRDIVVAAIKEDGDALEYASERLKNDFDIVCMAGDAFGQSVAFAGELICDNKDYVRILHTKYKSFAFHMSDRLQDDKDFALELIGLESAEETQLMNYRPTILRHLSDRLRNDREIVAACVFENASEFYFASEELRYDRDFVLEILTNLQVDISDCLPKDFILDLEIQAALRKLRNS